jgi:uncharacterized protein (DUF111 family)
MLAPVLMKKGRPGHWLVVTGEPADADRLAELVLRQSPTLGVRVRTETRLELARRFEKVVTTWGEVVLKVASLPDGTERAMPEFESVRQISVASGVPVREISDAAVSAWLSRR